MDRIKSSLTDSLVSVDKARNHYRDHGCDDQLPTLITEAYVHVAAARNAILDRARHIKRAEPDPNYPDLIPNNNCSGCGFDRQLHAAGLSHGTIPSQHVCELGDPVLRMDSRGGL
jgi:hypothetical protein